MKQIEILKSLMDGFIKDASIHGVLLMGSVANETALPSSDLDLLILCDINEFVPKIIDGVLVECIYLTYEQALKKLEVNDMDVYHYLGSSIMYDIHGSLHKLMLIAAKKYELYEVNAMEKDVLLHWLMSVRVKLGVALEYKDMLKANYITATNAWRLIESVWAINNKPVPPSSTVLRNKVFLKITPSSDWFEKLFVGSDLSRAVAMIDIIDWALPLLKS